MNRENILATADAIEQHLIHDLGFNMKTFGSYVDETCPDYSGHNCNTVACIGGWARLVEKISQGVAPEPRSLISMEGTDHAYYTAKEFFGMTNEHAVQMFDPNIDLSKITPAHAVSVLRHFAETNVVDWTITNS
jgi:hypothetical protein